MPRPPTAERGILPDEQASKAVIPGVRACVHLVELVSAGAEASRLPWNWFQRGRKPLVRFGVVIANQKRETRKQKPLEKPNRNDKV